jgi:hypothetical protein
MYSPTCTITHLRFFIQQTRFNLLTFILEENVASSNETQAHLPCTEGHSDNTMKGNHFCEVLSGGEA